MHIPTRYFWLSALPTLLGFGLVVWSHVLPVRYPREFQFSRMLALLCGGLLATPPLLLLSWSLYEASRRNSGLCFLASIVLSIYLPIFFLRLCVWLGWLKPLVPANGVPPPA